MTTVFLARRRAPDDLHPRSGEITGPAEDLRRIRFDVGTRLSACTCTCDTDERERQRGTHEDQRLIEDQRLMIVLRCIRSRVQRVPGDDVIFRASASASFTECLPAATIS